MNKTYKTDQFCIHSMWLNTNVAKCNVYKISFIPDDGLLIIYS